MNWIEKYRFDINYFASDKDSKEIYEFIKNHDYIHDYISYNRDLKISKIFSDDNIDFLEYLNPYLNILYSNITTISTPVFQIAYIDDDDNFQFSSNRVETYEFDGFGEFEYFIYINKYKKIYSFNLNLDHITNKVKFRCLVK